MWPRARNPSFPSLSFPSSGTASQRQLACRATGRVRRDRGPRQAPDSSPGRQPSSCPGNRSICTPGPGTGLRRHRDGHRHVQFPPPPLSAAFHVHLGAVTPSHPGCPAQPGFHSLSTSPFNSSAGLSSPAPPAPPRPAPLRRKSHFISGAYCALIGPSNPPGSGTRRGLAAGSGRHPFKGTLDFLRGVILPPHGRSRAGPGAALATSGPGAPGWGWNGHGDRDRGWHKWPGQSPGSPNRWAELGLKSKLSEGGISVTSEGHTSRHPARAGSWEQGES